jgi:phage nucleotide-binding protein
MILTNAKDISRGNMTALLYGQPGMGKTTTIKYLPGKTLVLDVDRTTHVLRGCENIDICYVDNIKTWEDWEKILIELVNDYKGKYTNYAVDNISELERCLLSDLGSRGKNNGIPSQADYQFMQQRIVKSLRYMKNLEGNLIWTAWETTDLFTTPEGQTFNRAYPQINGKILNNVCGLCDVVGRIIINAEGKRGYTFSATNGVYAKNQYDDRKGCLQEELIPHD